MTTALRNPMTMFSHALFLVLLLALFWSAPIGGATWHWNASEDYWHDAKNWDPEAVPIPASTICYIHNGGTCVVKGAPQRGCRNLYIGNQSGTSGIVYVYGRYDPAILAVDNACAVGFAGTGNTSTVKIEKLGSVYEVRFTVIGSLTINELGRVEHLGGICDPQSGFTLHDGGQWSMSGGELRLGGAAVIRGTLSMSGGEVTTSSSNPQDLEIGHVALSESGTMNWSGGTMDLGALRVHVGELAVTDDVSAEVCTTLHLYEDAEYTVSTGKTVSLDLDGDAASVVVDAGATASDVSGLERTELTFSAADSDSSVKSVEAAAANDGASSTTLFRAWEK